MPLFRLQVMTTFDFEANDPRGAREQLHQVVADATVVDVALITADPSDTATAGDEIEVEVTAECELCGAYLLEGQSDEGWAHDWEESCRYCPKCCAGMPPATGDEVAP